MLSGKARWFVVALSVTTAIHTESQAATLVANYVDSAGSGFFDPTYGAARRTAFEHALNIWSNILDDGYVGEVIQVEATFADLGGETNGSIALGQAGPSKFWPLSGSSLPSTMFASGLANHLLGQDLDGPDNEINAQFNFRLDTDITTPTRWYYGLDANPGSGEIDFVTVALHEIGHGLGLVDTIDPLDGSFLLSQPSIYDRFLARAIFDDGGDFIGVDFLDEMTNEERLDAITSEEIVWAGLNGALGNGGFLPVIYAPEDYILGSSIGHLDEFVHEMELISPFYSGPDHTPGPIVTGMLADIGWTIVPEPTALALMLGSCGLVALRRRA